MARLVQRALRVRVWPGASGIGPASSSASVLADEVVSDCPETWRNPNASCQRRHAASGGLYLRTMLDETITLRLPEELHHRLAAAATATRRSLEEILLHALRIGSPPAWDDAPPEHQAELAAMDRFDDDALWKLARGRRSEPEMVRYDELLEQSAAGALGDTERSELEMLRREADRFMLIKAHAAVLLRWRGHDVPIR